MLILFIDKLPTGVVDPLLLQCVSYLNKEEVYCWYVNMY